MTDLAIRSLPPLAEDDAVPSSWTAVLAGIIDAADDTRGGTAAATAILVADRTDRVIVFLPATGQGFFLDPAPAPAGHSAEHEEHAAQLATPSDLDACPAGTLFADATGVAWIRRHLPPDATPSASLAWIAPGRLAAQTDWWLEATGTAHPESDGNVSVPLSAIPGPYRPIANLNNLAPKE